MTTQTKLDTAAIIKELEYIQAVAEYANASAAYWRIGALIKTLRAQS